MLTVYIQHTSASLLIQGNADPDVLRDLKAFMTALEPEETAVYRHIAKGPDDMPAHIKGLLTTAYFSIPVRGHAMMLDTRQGGRCSSIATCLSRAR